HGLNNENSGHNRIAGKMAHEMGLVYGDVLDADDGLVGDLDNSVNHEHRITMRQEFRDLMHVEQCHGKVQYNSGLGPCFAPAWHGSGEAPEQILGFGLSRLTRFCSVVAFAVNAGYFGSHRT